jgi:hypothetical protein
MFYTIWWTFASHSPIGDTIPAAEITEYKSVPVSMRKCNAAVAIACFLVQSQLNKPEAELLWATSGVKPCTRRSVLIISKAQFEWCRS